jgi:hypothetical protein
MFWEVLHAIRLVFLVFAVSLGALPTAIVVIRFLGSDDDVIYWTTSALFVTVAVFLALSRRYSVITWILSVVSILAYVAAYYLIIAQDRPSGARGGLLNLAFMGHAALQLGFSIVIALSVSLIKWVGLGVSSSSWKPD